MSSKTKSGPTAVEPDPRTLVGIHSQAQEVMPYCSQFFLWLVIQAGTASKPHWLFQIAVTCYQAIENWRLISG